MSRGGGNNVDDVRREITVPRSPVGTSGQGAVTILELLSEGTTGGTWV